MSASATEPQAPTREVRLDLEGMTCASCVRRIERKLNKLDGVEATVNFATEQATVHCDQAVAVDELVAAVEAAGNGARLVDEHAGHHHDNEPTAVLARRLTVAAVLTTALAALAMISPLRFPGWRPPSPGRRPFSASPTGSRPCSSLP